MNLISNRHPVDGIRRNGDATYLLQELSIANLWTNLGIFNSQSEAESFALKSERTIPTKYRIIEKIHREIILELPPGVTKKEEIEIDCRETAATARWKKIEGLSDEELKTINKKAEGSFY
jgi:hypothetical protein